MKEVKSQNSSACQNGTYADFLIESGILTDEEIREYMARKENWIMRIKERIEPVRCLNLEYVEVRHSPDFYQLEVRYEDS